MRFSRVVFREHLQDNVQEESGWAKKSTLDQAHNQRLREEKEMGGVCLHGSAFMSHCTNN
jgi:hypothetical protein